MSTKATKRKTQLQTVIAKMRHEADVEHWSEWHAVGGGREARAKLMPDCHTYLGEDGDSFGKITSGRCEEQPAESLTWPHTKLQPDEVGQLVQMRIVGEEIRGATLTLRGGHDVVIESVGEDTVIFELPAVSVSARHDQVWWHPPEDAVEDPEVWASLEKRIREYFHEYWSYVGVVVEVRDKPCKSCGEQKVLANTSLWGIESDAGEYIEEGIEDLIAEVA